MSEFVQEWGMAVFNGLPPPRSWRRLVLPNPQLEIPNTIAFEMWIFVCMFHGRLFDLSCNRSLFSLRSPKIFCSFSSCETLRRPTKPDRGRLVYILEFVNLFCFAQGSILEVSPFTRKLLSENETCRTSVALKLKHRQL